MDTPPDTPAPDIAARDLAERVCSAYARQAHGSTPSGPTPSGPMHPQHEQALLTRLAEAVRPGIDGAEADLVAAVNGALDAFERTGPGLRGPRVASLDPAAGTLTLRGD